MRKKYDSKDFFIVADSKNDSVEKLSLLTKTKENFETNKFAPILGNSGKGTEFIIGENEKWRNKRWKHQHQKN